MSGTVASVPLASGQREGKNFMPTTQNMLAETIDFTQECAILTNQII